MNTEIERKFLIEVSTFEKLKNQSQVEYLKQGYYVLQKDFHTRVRIINDKEAFITSKTGSGLIRGEFEQPLDLDHALLIYSHCERTLEKQRLKISYKGFVWDVDYFPAHNLAVAEIELESESQAFEKPDWVLQEVTGDNRYSNIQLCVIKK